MLAFQNNTKQQKKILTLVMGIMRRGAWKKWIWLFFLLIRLLRDSCTSLLLHYLPSFWSHQVAIKQGMFPATQVSTKPNQQQQHSTSKKLNKNKNLHYIIITSCLLQKIATFHIYLGWLMKPLPLYLKSSWWGKINYTFSFSNLAYPNKNWKQF